MIIIEERINNRNLAYGKMLSISFANVNNRTPLANKPLE